MKTPTSSESGYFSLRISVASLLCICGVWLAAISFAPSALAWGYTSGGSPGNVTWASNTNPVIGMGANSKGSANFQLTRLPTISMSSAGPTYWQYATVTLYVYYWGSGQWHLFAKETKSTPWTPYWSNASVIGPLEVTPIPTTYSYYWTSLIQIVWWNDMRYTSNPWVAWETFYPNNPNITTVGEGTSEVWYGNADMEVNKVAELLSGCMPYGIGGSYNLNLPTGTIFVTQGGY